MYQNKQPLFNTWTITSLIVRPNLNFVYGATDGMESERERDSVSWMLDYIIASEMQE